jgi:hypothetical protein
MDSACRADDMRFVLHGPAHTLMRVLALLAR